MYPREEKKRAVKLYIKYDKSATAVTKELGYPSRPTLCAWYREYEEAGGKVVGRQGRGRYSKKQKRAAVRHYLGHGRCISRTVRALGYPCRRLLSEWIDELAPGEHRKHISGRAYSEDEKRDAVIDLVSRKASAADIAKTYGVERATLCNWRRRLLEDGGIEVRKDSLSSDTAELKEQVRVLQNEVYRLQLQKDILEGTVELLGKDQGTDPNRLTNREKTILIEQLRPKYRLKDLLEALAMPRSSHQYRVAAMARSDKYGGLRAEIGEAFADSGGSYGYRRIHAVIVSKGKGRVVSEKVVSRITSEEELVARTSRKRRRHSSYKGEISKAPANLVERDFHADLPNKLWLTDITEFKIPAGKAYLSPVIDCVDGAPVS